MIRTPRIVRIIPSICSTAKGDFVFFATGEKDYSKFPPMRSRNRGSGWLIVES